MENNDLEYWLAHMLDDEISLLGMNKPTHFRCEVCHRVHPMSEKATIIEHVFRTKRHLGTSFFGRMAIITTNYHKEFEHIVCKKCKEEHDMNDEKRTKLFLIILGVGFVVGVLGYLCFGINALIPWGIALLCAFFIPIRIYPNTEFEYKPKITDHEIFMAHLNSK